MIGIWILKSDNVFVSLLLPPLNLALTAEAVANTLIYWLWPSSCIQTNHWSSFSWHEDIYTNVSYMFRAIVNKLNAPGYKCIAIANKNFLIKLLNGVSRCMSAWSFSFHFLLCCHQLFSISVWLTRWAIKFALNWTHMCTVHTAQRWTMTTMRIVRVYVIFGF